MLERMKEDPFPINTERRLSLSLSLRCRRGPFHSDLSFFPTDRLLTTSKGEREKGAGANARALVFAKGGGPIRI